MELADQADAVKESKHNAFAPASTRAGKRSPVVMGFTPAPTQNRLSLSTSWSRIALVVGGVVGAKDEVLQTL